VSNTSIFRNNGRGAIADVAVINASSVCADAEIASYLPALQTQVTNHFSPFWGIDAQLTFVPNNSRPPADAWWLVVLDTSDEAGALGYHDLTPAGLPIGKVFAKSDKHYETSVSVTTSHELLEMLGDPGINMTAAVSDDEGNVSFLAFEACDACEDDKYGYDIDGVLVSDFVFPSWFGGVEATQYDYCAQIKEPRKILPGGYIGVWTPTTGWIQVTGNEAHGAAHRSRPSVGSRRERRRTNRTQWARSTAWA